MTMRSLLLSILLLSLAACGARKLHVEGVRRGGLGVTQFDDIPVPKEFRYQADRSFRYPDGPVSPNDLRLGQFHYYRIGHRVEQARAFFRLEMVDPIHGWTADGEEGDTALFTKGRDQARIRCWLDSDGVSRIVVDVNHRPKDGATTQ